MRTIEENSKVQRILEEIDRLISEMAQIRSEVAALTGSTMEKPSIREAEYFGMWTGREDMHGKSSREWLQKSRSEQWMR
jgi:hypothetical protein